MPTFEKTVSVQRCTVPIDLFGKNFIFSVQGKNQYGTSQIESIEFKFPPSITKITPLNAYIGKKIIVNGYNLTSVSSVKVGGVEVLYTTNNGEVEFYANGVFGFITVTAHGIDVESIARFINLGVVDTMLISKPVVTSANSSLIVVQNYPLVADTTTGFELSKSSSFPPSDLHFTTDTNTYSFTISNDTSLYFIRVYATNASGSKFTSPTLVIFTQAPSLSTAAGISDFTIAPITNDRLTEAYFQWSTDSSFATVFSSSIGSAHQSWTIDSLVYGNTYYVRAVFSGVYSPTLQVTLPPPSISDLQKISCLGFRCKLSTYNAGNAVSGLCIGKTQNPTDNTKPFYIDSDGLYTVYSLDNDSCYYVRAYWTISGITYYGSDHTVQTLPIVSPIAFVSIDNLIVDATTSVTLVLNGINQVYPTGVSIQQSIGGGLDDGNWNVPIGFSFSFQGMLYDTVYVCTNGFVTFSSNSRPSVYLPINYGSNQYFSPIPSDNNPNNSIFIAGRDNVFNYEPVSLLSYYTVGTTPARIFVLSGKFVEFGHNENSTHSTLVLHESDGSMDIHIKSSKGVTLIGLQLTESTGYSIPSWNPRIDELTEAEAWRIGPFIVDYVKPGVSMQPITMINPCQIRCTVLVNNDWRKSSITSCGICYSTSNHMPTKRTDKYMTSNEISTEMLFDIPLGAGATYYIRAFYTTNGAFDYAPSVFSGSVLTAAPIITTGVISRVNETSFQYTFGNIATTNYFAASSITSMGIIYYSNLPTTVGQLEDQAKSSLSSSAGANWWLTTIDVSLQSWKNMYIYAFATNEIGTTYGPLQRNLYLPVLSSFSISDVTSTSFSYRFDTICDGVPNVTSMGIIYYLNQPTSVGEPTGRTRYELLSSVEDVNWWSNTIVITGLTAYITPYYIYAFATNLLGTTYAFQSIFPPILYSGSISQVTSTSFRYTFGSQATVLPDVTSMGIIYYSSVPATVGDTGGITKTLINSGTGNWWFTPIEVTSLTANTSTYMYAFATNIVGTTYGTLQSIFPPVLSAGLISNVRATSFTYTFETLATGSPDVTSMGIIYYSVKPLIVGNTDGMKKIVLGSGTENWWLTPINVTNLTANTSTYIYAFAENLVGTTYGTLQSLPVLSSGSIQNVTPTSFTYTFGADGAPNFNTSMGIIYYSNLPSKVGETGYIYYELSNAENTISVTNLNLNPDTSTCYIYAFATNIFGTKYGDLQTISPPVLSAGLISGLTSTSLSTSLTYMFETIATGSPDVLSMGIIYYMSPPSSVGDLSGITIHELSASAGDLWWNKAIKITANAYLPMYIYAFAKNTLGTTYGPLQTPPVLSSGLITSVSETSFTYEFKLDGYPSFNDSMGIIYYTSPPVIVGEVTDRVLISKSSLSITVSDLISRSTVYIYSFAKNTTGTTYGPLQYNNAIVSWNIQSNSADFKTNGISKQLIKNVEASDMTLFISNTKSVNSGSTYWTWSTNNANTSLNNSNYVAFSITNNTGSNVTIFGILSPVYFYRNPNAPDTLELKYTIGISAEIKLSLTSIPVVDIQTEISSSLIHSDVIIPNGEKIIFYLYYYGGAKGILKWTNGPFSLLGFI